MRKLVCILTSVVFSAASFSQNRYDVVIDEIMPDPTPVVALPANEWIELKNTTAAAINLSGWRIGDLTGVSGAMPNFILQPDSFVLVCTGSAVAAMSAFGTTIPVTSFPSLDNDGDQLFLRAANGKIIHSVAYSSSWYQNVVKVDGGWSLEMIDTKSPCAGISNWKASVDAKGGTPGKKNSIDAVNNDTDVPKLKNAYTINNTTIVLEFNEPIDSLKGATVSNYVFDGGINILSAITLAPLFNTVQLTISSALQANTVYTITASNIIDCKNNNIGSNNKARVGLPVESAANELIINEILFNPRSAGYDYVELFNRSNKIFDASKIYIANRNSSAVVSSQKLLSVSPVYIFPGDYIVVTEEADNLGVNYLVQNPDKVFVLSTLPSYPDDEGDVVLLNFQGDIVDELKYKDDWHFKLIDDAEGVSLERIDPDAATQNENNWHSAASTAGYGTPTYKNSQYKLTQAVNATIEITPKVFSPDNDGRDDIATINYKVDAIGYVANITIFDVSGRPVRYLVRNGILGLTGYWNWDGLDDKGLKLPVGTYILYTEIFNLRGKKDKMKNTVVLARKLN